MHGAVRGLMLPGVIASIRQMLTALNASRLSLFLILSLDNAYIFPKVHYTEEPRSSDVVQRAERVEVLAAIAELETYDKFTGLNWDKVLKVLRGSP